MLKKPKVTEDTLPNITQLSSRIEIRIQAIYNFRSCILTPSTIYYFPIKWSESCSVVVNSLQPHGLYNPWNSPGQNTGVGNCSLLQGIFPTEGLNPARSPALQVDSLPAEPSGKPKNTGVDSLSLLQRIFPTQKSNWGLLHCRWILYQLSYEGSPDIWNHIQLKSQHP